MIWLVAGGVAWMLSIGVFCLLAAEGGRAPREEKAGSATGPEPVEALPAEEPEGDGEQPVAVESIFVERRGGEDRRGPSRAWARQVPGRRAEDRERVEQARRDREAAAERRAQQRDDARSA